MVIILNIKNHMGTLTHYSYSLLKTVYPQINAIFYAVAKLDKILESLKKP